MNYSHTQIGHLTIFALVLTIIIFGIVLAETGFSIPIILFMGIILIILSSFLTLNVTINKTHLRVKFGYGLFSKKFLLNEISSVQAVKNHWYFGWGIRVWFWPYMWIYNVSGFDAVEIVKKNGKRYRIGTDKPKELEHMILQSISNNN